MSTLPLRIAWPQNDKDFETLCLTLYRRVLDCPALQSYGRRGQNQGGLDLLGTRSDGTAIGVQCKLRHGAITMADISADIESARTNGLRLDKFIVATTAPRDAAIQRELHRLNDDHLKRGLFTVSVQFGDDIQEELNRHPDIRDDMLSCTTTRSEVRRNNLLLEELHATLIGADLGTDVDSQINAAFEHVARGDAHRTLFLLDALLERSKGRLDGRLLFRVHANKGNALASMERYVEAADCYLEAVKHHQSPDATALEARAHLWKGDVASATQLAARLCAEHPNFPRGHAIRLVADKSLNLQDAEASVPEALRRTEEVGAALYHLARRQGDLQYALQIAEEVHLRAPDWDEGSLLFSSAVLEIERRNLRVPLIGTPTAQDTARVSRVVDVLSRVISDPKAKMTPRRLANAYYNRATARKLLGDQDEARTDMDEAHRLAPDDAGIAATYAVDLDLRRNPDEAIRVLRKYGETLPPKPLVLLSILLAQRNGPGDRDEARRRLATTLSRIATDDDVDRSVRFEYLRVLLQLDRELDGTEAATKRLDSAGGSITDQRMREILLLTIGWTPNDKEKARSQALSLLHDLSLHTSSAERISLARALDELEEPLGVCLCLRPLVSDTVITTELLRYLRCAAEAGEEGHLLELCTALRQRRLFNRQVTSLEVHTLLRLGDRDMAVTALGQYVEAHPADWESVAWLALLQIESGRGEAAQQTLRSLPAPAECDPRSALALVDVCSHLGIHEEPVRRLAYDVFRRHRSDIEAWKALVSTILSPRHARGEYHPPATVQDGTAVEYVDVESNALDHVVLEDGEAPDAIWNEYAPNAPICVALKGHAIGDVVELPGALQQRRVRIVQISPKEIFRARRCASEAQRRFPSEMFVAELRMPSGDAPPDLPQLRKAFEGVEKMLGRRNDQLAAIKREYLAGRIPVQAAAIATSGSVVAFQHELVRDSESRVLCSRGSDAETSDAMRAMNLATGIVLDRTALATLIEFDLVTVIAEAFPKLVVPNLVLDELRQLICDHEQHVDVELSLTTDNRELTVVRHDPDRAQHSLSTLSTALSRLQSIAHVVTGRALLSKPLAERDLTCRVLGDSTAHALANAAELNVPVWADDLMTADGARLLWGVQPVTTAHLVAWLQERGSLSATRAEQCLVRLNAWGYQFTRTTVEMLVCALRMSNMDVDTWPAAQLLKVFSDSSVTPQSLTALLIGSLPAVWRAASLSEVATRVTMRILTHLDRRSDGRYLGATALRHLDSSFGLDVISAAAAKQCLIAWLNTPPVRGPKGIILP